ncbi:MAG: radical SAM protein [Bacteroidales bacterium]|nr:radical SAM protein [Bacteroidales bacterium]
MTDLAQFMTDNLRQLVQTGYRSVLGNPREARFALQLQRTMARGDRRRKRMLKKEGLAVPPFLIASIATTCNLQCKGCYARAGGIAGDEPTKETLSAEQWRALFEEAVGMGFSVSLLAGGEPLTRRDLLEQIAEVKDMLFPVFTNGTLIGPQYVDFFRRHLNVLPVISLEGDAMATNARRGQGVHERALLSMKMLQEAGLFFGTSITVTTENKEAVTAPDYVERLHSLGCKLVFYVEYVPIDPGTEHLAFGDDDVQWMENTVDHLRTDRHDMIFVSFPGDEKLLDGCMAAGRGFFHIGPDGAAEPCPFSPHSDTNASSDGLRAALRSPLFSRLRDASALSWEHTGGCTLYEHRDEVNAMLSV